MKQNIGENVHLENLHFHSPKMNVYKKKLDTGEIEYKIVFFVPSVNKEDIEITQVDDNTIEVEIKDPNNKFFDEFKDYQVEYTEFVVEKYKSKRKIVLPNINEIKQEFKNGLLVLTVLCGKRETRKKILLD